MTTQAVATQHVPDAATDNSLSQRLLALSGIAFVPLFLVGWFASGGVTPHYGAPDQNWVNWADDNQWKGRISAFAMFRGPARPSTGSRSASIPPTTQSCRKEPRMPDVTAVPANEACWDELRRARSIR
jgi:hypothetical protein